MANGLDPERLREQWDEIDQLNRELDDFTILKGIECDILEKGGMDLPDDVLAEADWVIASVHYGQKQPREQITDRILGALENPHVVDHRPSDRPADQPPRAVRRRPGRRIRRRRAARQAAGAQRQPGPARPGRRRTAPPPSGTASRSSSTPTPTAPAASTCCATASCKPAAPASQRRRRQHADAGEIQEATSKKEVANPAI